MRFFKKEKIAIFVTGNVHKFNEARFVLAEYEISVAMLNLAPVEIQDDKIEEIAINSATDAAKKSKLPIFVEDAGLFIKALNGFPGPYSSYVYRTLGTKGILRILEKVKTRDAYFLSAVAFSNSKKSEVETFKGRIEGKIAREEKGTLGFGYDPIFEPSVGNGKAFAEMAPAQKNRISHRAQALRKFADWYVGQS